MDKGLKQGLRELQGCNGYKYLLEWMETSEKMIIQAIRDNIREYPNQSRDTWISYESGRLDMIDTLRTFFRQTEDRKEIKNKSVLDD